MSPDQRDEDAETQEEAIKQRILAQRKEKKIKIIRILTVIAYLVSVSTVATMLSTYYIFFWNPRAGNYTQTPSPEMMALHRASSQYLFGHSVDHEYGDDDRFSTEVPNNYKTSDKTNNPERSITSQTSTIKSSTTHVQTTIGNISESFSVVNNLS